MGPGCKELAGDTFFGGARALRSRAVGPRLAAAAKFSACVCSTTAGDDFTKTHARCARLAVQSPDWPRKQDALAKSALGWCVGQRRARAASLAVCECVVHICTPMQCSQLGAASDVVDEVDDRTLRAKLGGSYKAEQLIGLPGWSRGTTGPFDSGSARKLMGAEHSRKVAFECARNFVLLPLYFF